jgi:glycosyltransferase involved in cell wall biosynthesis
MKILLAIDGIHARDGGPPVVVVNSAIAMANRGHQVRILALVDPVDETGIRNSWGHLQAAGVELLFVSPEHFSAWRGFPKQRAVIAQCIDTADVVHLHSVWSPFALTVGKIAKRLRRPYFVSSHGVFDHRAMTRIKSKWIKKKVAIALFGFKAFLSSAAGLVFGSAAEAEHSWLPTSDLKMAYIPNGVDEFFSPLPTPEQMAILYSAVPEMKAWRRTLLCRARIHEEKGHDMLVAAFDRVASEFPDCGVLIAGLKQDGALETRIRNFIAASPHRGRMVLTTQFTGPASNFLYHACDAYVAPSVAEGFSMSVVEALAHGRPMVITRFCHLPVVQDEGAGIIVEPDIASIAEGLRELLLQSDESWRAMGAAARALFLQKFTWDRVAEQIEDCYSASLRPRGTA